MRRDRCADAQRRLRLEPVDGVAVEADERHAALLEERREVGGEGRERRAHGEDLVLSDELLRRGARAVGVGGVVLGDEVDLAAVDAAGVVDVTEVRASGLLDRASERGESARQREDPADLDRARVDAGAVVGFDGGGCVGDVGRCRDADTGGAGNIGAAGRCCARSVHDPFGCSRLRVAHSVLVEARAARRRQDREQGE